MVINAPGGQAINLAVVSRLSWRRAGTRFNTRGVDDEGNAAAFVEVSRDLSKCTVVHAWATHATPHSFACRPRRSSPSETSPCRSSRSAEVCQVSCFRSMSALLSVADACVRSCSIDLAVFWEQQGLQAFGQKIQITRPAQASQPAFDKHFDELVSIYGPVQGVKSVPFSDHSKPSSRDPS